MPPKSRTVAPAAPPTPDPLADLREPEPDAAGLPTPATATEADDADAPLVLSLITAEDQDTLRAGLVATWHADTTASLFVHKGDVCGCHYLAGLAVRLIAPAAPDDADPEPAPEG